VKKRLKSALTVLISVLLFFSTCAAAQEGGDPSDAGVSKSDDGEPSKNDVPSLAELIRNGFSYNLRILAFFDAQYPARSTQNPDNAFLNLYRYSSELHLRPDFFLETPLVRGIFKPRMISHCRWWEDGIAKSETDFDNRVFVNEWLIQLRPHPSVFLSFGKEKLLWGPSFLVSPSNIMFKDTEKMNPELEVEGKYMAKMILLPSKILTFTAIYQTQKEENRLQEKVGPVQALKTDITGDNFLSSIIGYLQNGRFRLGSYGQLTASDAILLYYDGIISRGTDVLYPIHDQRSPFRGRLLSKDNHSGRLFQTITVGGSYTFLSGQTLSAEFLYNSEGYDDTEAKQYYQLRRNASYHFSDGDPVSSLSQKILAGALNTGSPFLRRYYLMAQYQQREIGNVLDVVLRCTWGLEEGAGQLSGILEWQVLNRIQVFSLNSVGIGGRDTEFKSVVSKTFMVGIEVHF
jgi:hypothetical protein